MTRITDIIVTPDMNLAETVNNADAHSTIELVNGTHVLTDALKPKDGVMLFSRVRGGALIMCRQDTGSHVIEGGHNVTLANIALMGHIGKHRQTAWINPGGTMYGLQLLHCDISNVFYRAVTIAPRMRIYDCTFRDIGVLGIGYNSKPKIANYDISIDHNEFANINGDNAGNLSEYGAMKLGDIHNSEVHDNFAHDCIEAYWVDGEPIANEIGNPIYGNYGLRITNNIAYKIKKSGIHYEISHDAYIECNFIQDCGQPNEDWAWGAGILIIDSTGSTVFNNVVDCRHGGNGISIGKQDRKPYAYHNRVDFNHIVYGAGAHSGIYDADNDKAGFFGNNPYYAGGNVYTRNNHYVPTQNVNRYGIEHRHMKFSSWQALAQDRDGSEKLHREIPAGLDIKPTWSLNNDFEPPLPKPPIIVDPPHKPADTTWTLRGMVTIGTAERNVNITATQVGD